MRLHAVDMHRGIPEELNMFQLRTELCPPPHSARRVSSLVRTHGASRRRTGRSEAEFFIHVAEKSVTSSCQPGDSRSPRSQ